MTRWYEEGTTKSDEHPEKKKTAKKKKAGTPKKVERIVSKSKKQKVETKNGEVEVENKKDREVPEEIKIRKIKDGYVAEKVTPEAMKAFVDNLRGLVEATIDEKLKNMSIQGGGEIPIMQRSQPSVEVKFDGKDKVSWTIKAYADSVDEAMKQAHGMNEKMLAKYGYEIEINGGEDE